MKRTWSIFAAVVAIVDGAVVAAPSGASVEKEHRIEKTVEVEGVPCGSATCSEGEFCAREAGSCDGPGSCKPRIDGMCAENYDSVCGCDGFVYGNSCEAHSSGINVWYLGECSAQYERVVEGGTSCSNDGMCSDSEYCERDTGSCDGLGYCKQRPQYCTMDYTPVCGCDGEIYSNLCGAYSKGMSVSYVGECGSNKQGWSFGLFPVSTTRDNSSGNHDGFPGAILCVIFVTSLAFAW